ncbi:MAG TPA: Crp/Fnr family transcriptional regulator [Acidobacteriaceae bacterium]|jgi:CRP/FNR family transcriptional regulator|nr:Crp/Fnr family transcriptional regulator [Acidobacteriaceae bacterium]
MPSDLFRELDAIAISTPVKNGSLLFRHGDPASAVYLVRSGRIAMIWCHSGQVYPMDTPGPGRIIGLPAIFNGDYSATAKAIEDSELGFIGADQVLRMLESDPHLMQAATRLLGQEVRRMRTMVPILPSAY